MLVPRCMQRGAFHHSGKAKVIAYVFDDHLNHRVVVLLAVDDSSIPSDRGSVDDHIGGVHVGPRSSSPKVYWSQAAIIDYLQRRVVNMFERRPHNQRRVRDHGMDGRVCSGATTQIMGR